MNFIKASSEILTRLTESYSYKYMCAAEKKKCITLLNATVRRLDSAIEAANREILFVKDYIEILDTRVDLLEQSIGKTKTFIKKYTGS